MTTEEMQKMGKDSMELMMSSFGAWTKNAQAIATEITDYSKKSIEDLLPLGSAFSAPRAWTRRWRSRALT